MFVVVVLSLRDLNIFSSHFGADLTTFHIALEYMLCWCDWRQERTTLFWRNKEIHIFRFNSSCKCMSWKRFQLKFNSEFYGIYPKIFIFDTPFHICVGFHNRSRFLSENEPGKYSENLFKRICTHKICIHGFINVHLSFFLLSDWLLEKCPRQFT